MKIRGQLIDLLVDINEEKDKPFVKKKRKWKNIVRCNQKSTVRNATVSIIIL